MINYPDADILAFGSFHDLLILNLHRINVLFDIRSLTMDVNTVAFAQSTPLYLDRRHPKFAVIMGHFADFFFHFGHPDNVMRSQTTTLSYPSHGSCKLNCLHYVVTRLGRGTCRERDPRHAITQN